MSRKNNPIMFEYSISSELLDAVASLKYLGVTLQSDMKWNECVRTVVSKADSRLQYIWRIFERCTSSVRETEYKTLVRPRLECCSSVWEPQQFTLKDDIEAVQRRGARFITGRFDQCASITEMLWQLNWGSVEERRRYFREFPLRKFRWLGFEAESSTILVPPTYIMLSDHKLGLVRRHIGILVLLVVFGSGVGKEMPSSGRVYPSPRTLRWIAEYVCRCIPGKERAGRLAKQSVDASVLETDRPASDHCWCCDIKFVSVGVLSGVVRPRLTN